MLTAWNLVIRSKEERLMCNFGICENDGDHCGLSCRGHAIRRLPELIRVIEQRELNGQNADDLIQMLDGYLRFFQTGEFCSECGSVVCKVTRPTRDLAHNS